MRHTIGIFLMFAFAIAIAEGVFLVQESSVQNRVVAEIQSTYDEYASVITSIATPRVTKSRGVSETFDSPFILEESWPMRKSGSPTWWVSSGAYLIAENGIGRTAQGSLVESDPWVERFREANARDTADGFRPQNIFRLVLKKKAADVTEEVYTRVSYYEESESEYRNESNGVLLFIRYQDEHTLYYVGIRVDGQAVIKKKLNGVYTTLASGPLFSGTYDRDTNPNLIPLDTWIGLKSETVTNPDGTVTVRLYTDVGKTGTWTLALEALDSGEGGAPITKAGYGGIRTDFMDVSFDDFSFTGR